MSSLTNVIDQSSFLQKSVVFSLFPQVMCLMGVCVWPSYRMGLVCLQNSPTWPLYSAGPFRLFTSSHIT